MTENMPPAEELLRRWLTNKPVPALLSGVKRLLKEDYRAYEIPLYAITPIDYAHDEEIREDLLDSLWTITHPDVLNALHEREIREGLHPTDADEIDADWRYLFNTDDETPVGYNLLLIQHRLGQRTSIVLEKEGDFATSFKVYGHSQTLIEQLQVLIGIPERFPMAPNESGMRHGDLADEAFVSYLELLYTHGKLPEL